jgi:hypothetical protein
MTLIEIVPAGLKEYIVHPIEIQPACLRGISLRWSLGLTGYIMTLIKIEPAGHTGYIINPIDIQPARLLEISLRWSQPVLQGIF